jgi:hypothetical protein
MQDKILTAAELASRHSNADKTRAFEWLRDLATSDGAPTEAGVAFDTWAALAASPAPAASKGAKAVPTSEQVAAEALHAAANSQIERSTAEPEAQKAVADREQRINDAARTALRYADTLIGYETTGPIIRRATTLKAAITALRELAIATPSPAASMEDAATLCEGLAEMMEQGAGEVRPGQRLRQAARGIRALAAKNGGRPGEGRG